MQFEFLRKKESDKPKPILQRDLEYQLDTVDELSISSDSSQQSSQDDFEQMDQTQIKFVQQQMIEQEIKIKEKKTELNIRRNAQMILQKFDEEFQQNQLYEKNYKLFLENNSNNFKKLYDEVNDLKNKRQRHLDHLKSVKKAKYIFYNEVSLYTDRVMIDIVEFRTTCNLIQNYNLDNEMILNILLKDFQLRLIDYHELIQSQKDYKHILNKMVDNKFQVYMHFKKQCENLEKMIKLVAYQTNNMLQKQNQIKQDEQNFKNQYKDDFKNKKKMHRFENFIIHRKSELKLDNALQLQQTAIDYAQIRQKLKQCREINADLMVIILYDDIKAQIQIIDAETEAKLQKQIDKKQLLKNLDYFDKIATIFIYNDPLEFDLMEIYNSSKAMDIQYDYKQAIQGNFSKMLGSKTFNPPSMINKSSFQQGSVISGSTMSNQSGLVGKNILNKDEIKEIQNKQLKEKKEQMKQQNQQKKEVQLTKKQAEQKINQFFQYHDNDIPNLFKKMADLYKDFTSEAQKFDSWMKELEYKKEQEQETYKLIDQKLQEIRKTMKIKDQFQENLNNRILIEKYGSDFEQIEHQLPTVQDMIYELHRKDVLKSPQYYTLRNIEKFQISIYLFLKLSIYRKCNFLKKITMLSQKRAQKIEHSMNNIIQQIHDKVKLYLDQDDVEGNSRESDLFQAKNDIKLVFNTVFKDDPLINKEQNYRIFCQLLGFDIVIHKFIGIQDVQEFLITLKEKINISKKAQINKYFEEYKKEPEIDDLVVHLFVQHLYQNIIYIKQKAQSKFFVKLNVIMDMWHVFFQELILQKAKTGFHVGDSSIKVYKRSNIQKFNNPKLLQDNVIDRLKVPKEVLYVKDQMSYAQIVVDNKPQKLLYERMYEKTENKYFMKKKDYDNLNQMGSFEELMRNDLIERSNIAIQRRAIRGDDIDQYNNDSEYDEVLSEINNSKSGIKNQDEKKQKQLQNITKNESTLADCVHYMKKFDKNIMNVKAKYAKYRQDNFMQLKDKIQLENTYENVATQAKFENISQSNMNPEKQKPKNELGGFYARNIKPILFKNLKLKEDRQRGGSAGERQKSPPIIKQRAGSPNPKVRMDELIESRILDLHDQYNIRTQYYDDKKNNSSPKRNFNKNSMPQISPQTPVSYLVTNLERRGSIKQNSSPLINSPKESSRSPRIGSPTKLDEIPPIQRDSHRITA